MRKSQIIIYFCQIKPKGIKKPLKILSFTIAGIILFFAIIFILLKISRVQNFIAQSVVNELSSKFKSKVSLGRVEYKFFNSITLDDFYVEDLQGDTLLFSKHASAHFNLWQIFKGKVLITSMELDELYGNLVVDKSGRSNLDFVIKAFQNPQKNDSTHVEYRIKKFEIRNSTFCYTNHKMYRELRKNIFNGNKLKFRHINAEVSLDVLNKDTLSARILSLNAVEQSGLTLTNLTTQILGSHKGVQLPQIILQLPNSQIHLDDIQLKYDSLADLNHIIEKVRWNIPLSPSYVALSDLAAFVPEFKNMHNKVTVKGLITGRISNLHFQKVEIKYGKSFLFQANLDINGLPRFDESFIYGQINELRFEKNDLQDFISEISGKPFLLPNEMTQLGMIRYKGNITGFLSNLVAYGNLNTNIGSVSTDILLKIENELRDWTYNGTIKSNNLALGQLFNNKHLGNASFSFNTAGTKKGNASLSGTISAKVSEIQINKYSYRNVELDGKYDGKGFNGNVNVVDENIEAHFTGQIDLTKKLPVFNFELKVPNINFYALNLIDKYQGATLAFNGKTNMVGNSLDNINGYVRFDSIIFRNKDKTLKVDEIQFVSRIEKNLTHFAITSDYVNGSFNGNFKYSTIGGTVNRIVQNYLPVLAVANKNEAEIYSNHIDVDLKIANTQEISKILELPYTVDGVATIKGYLDDNSKRIDLYGSIPSFSMGKISLENINLHCENPNKQLILTTRTQLNGKDGLINFYLLTSAAKDSVHTRIIWQNSQQITNAGEILAETKFRNDSGKVAARVSILPTQVIIDDSIWNIHTCNIDMNADSTIGIHNFLFDSHKQFVHINGLASKNQSDSVNVEMNDLNLDFIMGLLKLKGISLGGNVTGKATLLSVLQHPIFEADLSVKDFTLNHKWVGNGKVNSSWDKINNQLLAHGTFTDANKDTIVVANAIYTPVADSIDVIYNARNFSIEFLTPYFESVVQNVKGFATGKIRMFGPMKNGIRFSGDVIVNKGQGSVKILNTTYFLNDSVHLTPETISFRNVTMYDQERNPAVVNAVLTHNGLFQEMTYDATIKGTNILAMDTHAENNDYFFGKAYANGTVRIFGDQAEANIIVNAVSQPQTKCYIQMGGASKASDNSFITFVNKKVNTRPETIPAKKVRGDFNVKINLQIDVNPNAEMELLVDPKGGDVITGTGNGSLHVEFDTFSDIKLYGTYTLDNGYYLFTLQNVIRKEFKIDKGSTIAWTGDPFNAQVKIRALYPLTASLNDLDPTILSQGTRSTVPVNCVLKLSDNLMKPTVSFDINLPQSDESIKQRVRNIINTDEMMNRQIIYLLVFNKFFTPDYLRTANSTVFNNEGLSLLLSTASAQINSLVSQFTKSNNFTVGLDYQQRDLNSSEIMAPFSYQPSNRWLVNGNLGYRMDNAASSTNKFIGDVDIEYLLSKMGKFRLKFYNHTIDRYLLQQSSETVQGQGIGILYKEEFASVDDLFSYYWRLLTVPAKKKSNEKKQTNNK